MAYHSLAEHFDYFFRRLNPSPSFEQRAASEYQTIKGLLEAPTGPAWQLSPQCFLQGSYRQSTAIHAINDVDVVALCSLWQPGASGGGVSWGREEIFACLAAPLLQDGRYRDKVRYHSRSMCIKVDIGIKVEILPVVYKAGTGDPQMEPFRLFRPETQQWEDGYARYHQRWLTWKNQQAFGNYIPAIKVFKHLRSLLSPETVSFHIECLLFALPHTLFQGNPATYIPTILNHLASFSPESWYLTAIKTPCGERDLFTASEWTWERWQHFYQCVIHWHKCARAASEATAIHNAIECWQLLLGDTYFPKVPG